MASQSEPRVRKRSTNVSLREDLVQEAKALGIGVSQACEQGLSLAVQKERDRVWIEENRAGIDSWNAYVARHGVPLAKYRAF